MSAKSRKVQLSYSNEMRFYQALSIALVALAIGACYDYPLEEDAHPTPTAAQVDYGRRNNAVAFEIDILVTGNLKPHHDIVISVRARANMRARNARFKIVAPELQMARKKSWPSVTQFPVGVHIEPEIEEAAEVTPGVVHPYGTVLNVAEPGYYRIVASAISENEGRMPRHPLSIQNEVHKEVWLLIDANGGRITPTFDPALVPTGMIPQPGPWRAINGVRESSLQPGTAHSVQGNLASSNDGYDYWRLIYFDQSAGQYAGVPGAYIDVKYFREEYGNSIEFQYSSDGTGSNGDFSIDCSWLAEGEWYEMSASLGFMSNGGPWSIGGRPGGTWCGTDGENGPFLGYVPSIPGHISRQLFLARMAATTVFSRTRGDMPYVEYHSDPGSSWYQTLGDWNRWGGDEINIHSDDVWGAHGVSVIAHEYGHGFHHKMLGGIGHIYFACPSHQMYVAEGSDCAYLEGFAHFFAAATRGIDGEDFSLVQAGYAVTDGYAIELSFASFLYDVWDSDNSSHHDAVTLSGSIMGDVISTCTFYNGARVDASSHITYCFEGAGYGAWIPDGKTSAVQSSPFGLYPAQVHRLAQYHLTGVL